MSFNLHPGLAQNSVEIFDWNLSQVRLKNEKNYIWFILIPKIASVTEIDELQPEQQVQLIREVSFLSAQIRRYHPVDKINVGALGNIVNQLHVHVIGRFKDDPLWPHSIWQAGYQPQNLSESEMQTLQQCWQERLIEGNFLL